MVAAPRPILQASLQQRIGERRRQAGRWMGGDAGGAAPRNQRNRQQQPWEQPPEAQQWAPPPLEAQQQQQQQAGMDLTGFLRGGLQRKVSSFFDLTSSLRRRQDARGADVSWGRRDARTGGAAGGGDGWEQQLNVTRVQRRPAGADGQAAPVSQSPPPPPPHQQSHQQQQQQSQQPPPQPAPRKDEGLDW